MQTYYDYTLRKWVTRQADGSVRDATSAEALDAYSRGAQAPAGTPGPGTTSPTPALNPAPDPYPLQRNQQSSIVLAGVTYNWNTKTGKYEDANGGSSSDAPPVVAPSPPATDPYTNWMSSDPSSRSYRYFSPDLKQYYEKNPDQAYRQYVTGEFGDRQTPLADYARGKYNDYYAQYIQASEADPTGGSAYTDSLTNGLAAKIRNSFNMQSPTQKGYSLLYQPAGRWTG